jgi:hypothetical protein
MTSLRSGTERLARVVPTLSPAVVVELAVWAVATSRARR